MNEKETSKDIIAEMRTKAECAKPYDDGIVMMLTDYADRFEAALKREQSQSWHHREMEELVLRHEKELVDAKKSSGDAAKLRKALETLLNLAYEVQDANSECGPRVCITAQFIIDEAKSALTAPPRNCDRFSTWEEANKAFEKENAHRIGFMNLYTDVLKWLFAPATEGGDK